MLGGQTPKWLRVAERYLGWLAIPNIAILFVTLQALGFFFVASNPAWVDQLALYPSQVFAGEYWRLVTFLALPLSMSPIWVLFVLWFLYFIINTIENEWGAFKTTLYVLISILVTIAYSLGTGYPVANVSYFEATLFLAAAALYPEMEVRLFLILPVKMKWLAWLTLALVCIQLLMSGWMERFYILAIFSNYLIFFGPAVLYRVKNAIRKARFKQNLRR